MPNFAFKNPMDEIEDGGVIDGGNFSQLLPGTAILVGKTLTINGGNWINVQQQPEWTVNGGNWAQINRCSHLHPELVARGLPECVVECNHMMDKTEVVIDGVLIDTIYTYEDTVL